MSLCVNTTMGGCRPGPDNTGIIATNGIKSWKELDFLNRGLSLSINRRCFICYGMFLIVSVEEEIEVYEMNICSCNLS